MKAAGVFLWSRDNRNRELWSRHVISRTVTQVCVVTAAVVVLTALSVAVALVLRVVLLIASAFTRSGPSLEENTHRRKHTHTHRLINV